MGPSREALAARAPFLSSTDTVLDTCAPARRASMACAIDGDTFDLGACGSGERIRVLGMDAPEIAHAGAPADCGADAATQALTQLQGVALNLTFDQVCLDTFGRTLAWPWIDARAAEDRLGTDLVTDAHALLGDPPDAPVLVPLALVAGGLARRYDPAWAEPTRYDGALAQGERQARTDLSGLWGSCDSPDDSGR